jgi:predicted PurR-regulated permease PerM
MVGGAVGGIVGIYLSVPLVAALRVIYRRFARPPTDLALQSSFVQTPDPKAGDSAIA